MKKRWKKNTTVFISGPDLIKLLREYGLKRWMAARYMGVTMITFDRYTLPPTSKHYKLMPKSRWTALREALDNIDKELSS